MEDEISVVGFPGSEELLIPSGSGSGVSFLHTLHREIEADFVHGGADGVAKIGDETAIAGNLASLICDGRALKL